MQVMWRSRCQTGDVERHVHVLYQDDALDMCKLEHSYNKCPQKDAERM